MCFLFVDRSVGVTSQLRGRHDRPGGGRRRVEPRKKGDERGESGLGNRSQDLSTGENRTIVFVVFSLPCLFPIPVMPWIVHMISIMRPGDTLISLVVRRFPSCMVARRAWLSTKVPLLPFLPFLPSFLPAYLPFPPPFLCSFPCLQYLFLVLLLVFNCSAFCRRFSFQSLATVREALVGLLTTLLKAKQAREQVLQWVAAVANHNRCDLT